MPMENQLPPDCNIAPDRCSMIFTYIFSNDSLEKRAKVLEAYVENVHKFCIVSCGSCLKLKKSFDQYGDLPTYKFAVDTFGLPHPLYPGEVNFAEAMALVEQERDQRAGNNLKKSILEIGSASVSNEGDLEAVRKRLLSTAEKFAPVELVAKDQRPSEAYKLRKSEPAGFLTAVKDIDDLTLGQENGTVFTLMAFVGHCKTTFAMNILYNNVINLCYNMVFLTLEVPKDILKLQLLSRHSYNPKFAGQAKAVPSLKAVKGILDPEEEEFLFNVVEPDLYDNEEYGKFAFLENTEFNSLSLEGISTRLQRMDFPVDGLIVDYLQLLQYYPPPSNMPRNISTGDYYVRQLAEYAKGKMGDRRRVILLSQTNRQGHERAVSNDGMYDLQALSEFHELERSSSYVVSIFLDEALKEADEAKVALLKNRLGPVMGEPTIVQRDPKFCVFGSDLGEFSSDVFEGDFSSFLGID